MDLLTRDDFWERERRCVRSILGINKKPKRFKKEHHSEDKAQTAQHSTRRLIKNQTSVDNKKKIQDKI